MSLNDTTVLTFGGSRNIGYLSSVRLLGKISQLLMEKGNLIC